MPPILVARPGIAFVKYIKINEPLTVDKLTGEVDVGTQTFSMLDNGRALTKVSAV
jgi:hypothetical protein